MSGRSRHHRGPGDAVPRALAWLGGGVLAMAAVMVVIATVMHSLATTVTVFVLTPGGLIIVLLMWRWAGRSLPREDRRREWWRG